MLPTYAPHKARNRRPGVYIVLVVILSVGLVAQFAYWRRQVADLVAEVDLIRAKLEQQEALEQQLVMESSKQKGEYQTAMEEKAEMERVIKFLENAVKSDEVRRTMNCPKGEGSSGPTGERT